LFLDLNYNAAVGLQAFNRLLAANALAINHWFGLAFAHSMQAFFFDTLADKMFLDADGTAFGKGLIVAGVADAVGMT
jgi:hypothetical protein